MKLLFIHCDYIKFKAKQKALKNPEELTEEGKRQVEVKEPLVVFIAVEKRDENNKEIVEKLLTEIKDVAGKVNAKNIVLYPYAHLSSNLSNPQFAEETLKKAEEKLTKEFKVSRAPFGYYKEFELKCKGHPLSELSREITSQTSEEKSTEEKYDPIQLLREITKTKLDTSKLKENDHRILSQRMNLFSFSDIAPGMIFWHNNGFFIYNGLIDYWRELHRRENYQEISTPQILDKKLWQISGHWEKYKDNIFLTDYEGRTFAVKPMNCPGGMLVFKNKPKSYKDLPLRMAELGIVHRQELSGVLAGLFRVIKFTQDDAHLFCTEDQLEEEIKGVIKLVDEVYKKFGFEYHIELSTRPEKRIGDEKLWDKAEKVLEDVLKKTKIKYKVNKRDGAFYGPKIDFHIKDSLERTWQCGTIQLDFAMPERFDLEYIGKDNKNHRPVMIHRVIYGSIERFIGVLLEHTNGNLPLWLSPKQVRIINFTDRNTKACEKLKKELEKLNIRVDIDLSQEPISGKIKQAEIEKVSYIIVIGDKEEKEKTLAVRSKQKVKNIKKEEFIKKIKEEIDEKR